MNMIGTSAASGEYVVADDGRDNENTRGGRASFGASSLRDALRAVAGLREPTTRPTEAVAPPEPHPAERPVPQPQAVAHNAETGYVEVEPVPSAPPMPAPHPVPAASVAPVRPEPVPAHGETIDLVPSSQQPSVSAEPHVPQPAPSIPVASEPVHPDPQAQPVPRAMPEGGQTMLLRPEDQQVAPLPEPIAAEPIAPVEVSSAQRLPSTAEPTVVAKAPAISQNVDDPAPETAPPAEPAMVEHEAPAIASGSAAMNSLDSDDNKTRMVRGVQKPGRDDYYQEPVVAWLVVIGGPGLGAFRPVYEGNNAIGRAQTQRISIDFGDDAISAEEQAYIRYDSTDRSFLFVPNLAKTNVVSLNESKPTSAVPLAPMDVITVGQTQLVFVPFCGAEFDWSELRNINSGA